MSGELSLSVIVIGHWIRVISYLKNNQILFATIPFLLDFIQTVANNMTENTYLTVNSFLAKNSEIKPKYLFFAFILYYRERTLLQFV